jgi:hypothetical protein
MKRKLSTLALLAVLLSSLSVAPVGAKAPLTGEMDLQINLQWSGPSESVPVWSGTIEIRGETYGMVFFAIGSGKPFDGDPNTTVHFFEEIWKIYDRPVELDENGVLLQPDEGVLLWGYDSGVTNLVNSTYRMNGGVEEAAEAFDEWVGRNVHMSGAVTEWLIPGVVPLHADGTFRIN